MLVALLLATLTPTADPAALPDRWLFKLLPADPPSLPDRLHAVTWYDSFPAQNPDSAWRLWIDFRKADRGRAAEADLTLIGGSGVHPPGGRKGDQHNLPLTAAGRRTVPLAVHGPLVEFDGRLYTAAFGTWKFGREDRPDRELLHLGSAVEAKDRVWYQAGTSTAEGGKKVTVDEWRLEFKDDPKTAAKGTVTVRSHSRGLTDPEGESFTAETRFKAEPPTERTGARIVTLLPPDGKKLDRKLPYLVFGTDKGQATVIWTDGQDRLSLFPAPAQAPKPLVPAPHGLVQPPVKPPAK